MAATVQPNDRQAPPVAALGVPLLSSSSVSLYEARATLLARDYAAAADRLHRALLWDRHLLTFLALQHTQSPFLILLCHFYLGQVYEAAGEWGQAISQYREFLWPFEGFAPRLPRSSEAHAALRRLGAQ